MARACGAEEQRAGQACSRRRAAVDHRSSLARFCVLSLCGQDCRGRVNAAPWQTTCFCGGGPRNLAAVRWAPVPAVDGGQALLERDAALALIDRRLREAVAGRGSLLLVEGPAGIGKTRLGLAAGPHCPEPGL